MSVTPTGAVHEVGLEEMFFSATDRRGVLNQANDVFVRLARRPREDLLGAPHNVIRHPAMPGGVFRTMWRMMLAGEPTCGYIVNLAGDGSAYWTLATIVPVPGGYLSVRTKPCIGARVREIASMYDVLHDAEVDARAAGTGAASVAMMGEELLAKELAGVGFTSYLDHIRDMLPAELDARLGLGGGLPQRDDVTGPMATTLTAVTRIESQLRLLSIDLRGFHQESAQINALMDTAAAQLGELIAAVAWVHQGLREAEVTGSRATWQLAVRAGEPLQQRCAEAETAFAKVVPQVHELSGSRADLRYRVALAQLQAEMMGRYLLDGLDLGEDASSFDAAVRSLAWALDHGVTAVSVGLAQDTSTSAGVRERIEAVTAPLRIARMALSKWRSLISQAGVDPAVGTALPALDRALTDFTAAIDELADRVEVFGKRLVVFELEAVRTAVAQVLTAIDSPTVDLRPTVVQLPDGVTRTEA